MLKRLKWSSILLSVAMIIAGILLIIYPDVTASIVCAIIGVGFIVYGIIELVTYFMLDVREILNRNEFAIGIISLLIGILVLSKQSLLLDLIPIILGLIICISGMSKLQQAVVASRIGYPAALQYTILGLLDIILGIVVMFVLNGKETAEILFRVIGVGLIYSGASDLYVTLFLTGKFKKFEDAFRTAGNEAAGNVFNAETGEVEKEDSKKTIESE